MKDLLCEIRDCRVCAEHLPLGPRPIIEASEKSKIILISQAPGRVVHESGIAWKDQSGKKLREWLGVDDDTFYDTSNFAILPMGFCYPGKAKTGDLPPRKECAPLWHDQVWNQLSNTKLKILIGSYAANYYLGKKENLTQKVQNFEEFLPEYWTLPHPSPVNRFWRMNNPWFEDEVVPRLQNKIAEILS
ncbi:uracil-DNA glycosylase family protein [Christiangramia sabulilitoris]|uniref:Uracil-DNA glycosylase family protein n=1 Tax=Christiangramia sabulilitoris TaxID=2583991 RepID=A0A550I8Y7_9FLAO|nr:uracil-DNA glycosylase family protein [Christiangramia sabulilitoris]TRO67432.1 uracil-DNA glycosylase family protein [Christiangramia sabulilitoris]